MKRDDVFTPPDWYPQAPCATGDVEPDAWFPEQGNDGREAKAVCARCPYKAPCLAGALERKERFGIYAGVAVGRRCKGRPDAVEAA